MISYWDFLPDELQNKIIEQRAAIKIQEKVVKRLSKKYGHCWKDFIKENNEIARRIVSKIMSKLNHYCYLTGIDPIQ